MSVADLTTVESSENEKYTILRLNSAIFVSGHVMQMNMM